MADKSYDILINIDARVQAIQEAVTQTQKLVGEASGLQSAFGFASIIELTHRLADGFAEVSKALIEGIKSGVEFNAEIQDLQTNIAGILRLTQSDQFGSFASAKAAAGDYIEVIKAAANKVGISYHDMFETVHETQAQLAAAGITDIHQTIAASLLLAQAMQAVGVGAQNASRDVGDLLQGNARTQGGQRLASALGLTTEELQKMIQAALQSGTMVDLLTTKFASLQDAITDASQNFNADLNRMKNLLVDLESQAAKPIMEPLRQSIDGAIDPTKTEQLRIIARVIGEIGAAAIGAASGVASLAGSIARVGEQYSGLVGVLKTIAQFNPVGLNLNPLQSAALDFLTDATGRATKAVLAEEAAAKSAAAAHTAGGDAIARKVQLTEKEREEIEKTNAAAKLLVDTRAGNVEEIAIGRASEATRKLREEWEKIHPLTQEQSEALNRLYVETYNTVIAQQEHKQAVAGSRDATREERDARRDISNFLREQAQLLQKIQEEEKLIEENPFLSADQRNNSLHALYLQQQEEVNSATHQTQQRLNAAYGSGTQQEVDQLTERLRQLTARTVELGYKTQTTTFGGQVRAELTQWVNSFGTAAHAVSQVITGTLNSAIGATSQALTGLIFHTNNWKQAFASAAQSIVSGLINIVLQYVIGQAVMFAVRKLFGGQDDQQTSQQASAAAAKWAPAAISASIASYGSAALTGTAAYAAAIIAGTALSAGVAGGFFEGGHTGFGDPRQVAGVVHGQEYVFDAKSVQVWGLRNLDAMRYAARQGGSFATGGYTGPGDGGAGHASLGGLSGSRQVNVINVFDEKQLTEMLLKNKGAENLIVNHVRKNRIQLGFPS